MTQTHAELALLVDRWRPATRKTTVFKKRSKKAPGDLACAQRLAALARAESASDEGVIAALAVACSAYDGDRSIRVAYASALADAGRIGDAIAEFEERLGANPDDADCLLDVASLYERAQRADLAADRLRRAIDLQVAAGDVDAAIGAARRLIALEPGSLESAADLVALLRARDTDLLAEGLEHLADVYRDRGKLGQEAAACAELVTLQPGRADVRSRLSSIYTRILEVDPDDAEAWVGLAAVDGELAEQLRVLLESEHADGNAAAIHAATASRAADAPADRQQAYALRKARELIAEGDVLGASLCLERVVRSAQDPRHRLELAKCYRTLHRDREAEREGLRALAHAQTGRDGEAAEAALAWLAEALPWAQTPLEDALFLNHRPESADILYEELLAVVDAARVAASPSDAAEPREA